MNVAQAFLPVLVWSFCGAANRACRRLSSRRFRGWENRHGLQRIDDLVAQALACGFLVSLPIVAATHQVKYADLTANAQAILARQGIDADKFPSLIHSINQETGNRLRDGEHDHLIYFVLQSTKFTNKPRIEPALSAREFVENLKAASIPRDANERMQDFLRALARPQSDERMNWFQKSLSPEERTLEHLSSEYLRAMRFLYQKEFAAAESASTVYQQRGHSSDTRIESSFAVWNALSVLKSLDAAPKMNRVLIAGPGEDFAPRTDLVDKYPPQSYQPYAVADALLALGLAGRDRLRIDCVDINDRVLHFFREFANRREPRLTLFEQWDDPEYVEYFRALGRHIGTYANIRGGKSLSISKDLAGRVSAAKLNVITERYDPPPEYDLIVATNILVYFNNTELLLALSNLQSMLKQGGVLIHNEVRPEVEEFSKALGFPPLQARTLRLSQGKNKPLFDSFVIHLKAR